MTKSLEDQTTTVQVNTSKPGSLGPIVYLALLATTLTSIASKALILDKSCHEHLNEKCYYLRDLNELDNLHRYLYSYYVENIKWLTVLQYLLPIMIILFVGGWSDRTGKMKMILLLPIIGWSLQSISGIVNAIFFHELPLMLHMFLDTCLAGVLGGPSLLFLGLLNYICNMPFGNTRIYHIFSIVINALSGIPLGLALSNIILKNYGYLPIYGLALMVNSINLLYITFKVTDSDQSDEQIKCDGQGAKHFLRNFFNLSTIKETVQTICKKTEDNRILHLSLYLFIITTLYISIFGEISVMDVIVRYFYKWEKSMINIFFIYYALTSAVGLSLLVIVIEKWLKWHEFTIGIFSSACKIISAFVFCFVPNEILFVIGPLVAMFNGGALIAAISQCTKLLDKNEIGKINILLCLLWNVAMVMYMPMKFRVNGDTSYELANPHHLWGTMYLLGGAFALPALIAFIYLLHDHRKSEKNNTDMDNLIVN